MSTKNSSGAPAGITFSTITNEDVPAMLRVFTAAHKPDLFNYLMMLHKTQAEVEQRHERMAKIFESMISNPDIDTVKAVDETGQLVAFSSWERRDFRKKDESTDPNTVQESEGTKEKQMEQVPPPKTAAPQLGAIMGKDAVETKAKHLDGQEFWELTALCTSPSHQGRGIGSWLVQMGTRKADLDGLPCWAHAGPCSYKLYEKQGFSVVSKLDLDLDEWAPGGKGANQGWGRFTFRNMLRTARSQ